MDVSANRPEYLVGAHPVPTMTATEECDRARSIRALRVRLWTSIFLEPKWWKPMAASLVETLHAAEEHALADEIAAHAERRLRRIGPKWAAQADVFAARLVEIDPLSLVSESELRARVADRDATTGRDPALAARVRQDLRELIAVKQAFVLANLGLVFKVAGRFRGRGLSFRDLVQEGNLGLMRAVDLFDPERGFRFSTYAVWWIRHSIDRAIADRGRGVRVPVHLVTLHRKLERARRRMETERGRSPTLTELAALCGAPTTKIELADQALTASIVSIDPAPTEERTTPVDLPDEDSHAAVEVHLMAEGIDDLLGRLSDFEADIVRKRFGLGDQDPMTLQEIGDEYALSRERIRQIEKRALGRMRAWSN
jgi:RNA polymerase primary sigma factor